MATYKVLQDIEAEDKLVGPLSFRQCVYAGVAIMCLYLSYLVSTHHAAFMLVILLPPALFCLFFAIPWQQQQSTEVWALAKIRFMFKPRRRIWDQSGVKELVTITVPKHIEVHYTDGLSQTEVSSRLKALAETIDSRGWAIKNVPMNSYNQPVFANTDGSDRLMGIDDFAQEVPSFDESATTDVLDTQNNPIAKQFDQMMTASRQVQRQHIMDSMQSAGQPAQPHTVPGIATQGSSAVPYWFTQQYTDTTIQPTPAAGVLPQVGQVLASAVPTAQIPMLSDSALLEQLHATSQRQSLSSAHMRTIQPLSASAVGQNTTGTQPFPYATPYAGPAVATPLPAPVALPVQPVTPRVDPAILELANNNDLNVATIAREANKHSQEPPSDPNEVVISLH
jgi:hypothetical protein